MRSKKKVLTQTKYPPLIFTSWRKSGQTTQDAIIIIQKYTLLCKSGYGQSTAIAKFQLTKVKKNMTNLNQKKIQQKNAKQNASKQMLFKELFLNIIHFFNLKV